VEEGMAAAVEAVGGTEGLWEVPVT
jgi:hypothetical protein